ncbi:oligosaccharide repeat unit polymerase [Roseobacter sp. AzwK-3b]|uniref:oligosaccharide repeat unit polymerase n=1 Tax=Roseobacter sp. AzwK-3b TaxID=351016 RepID=UPI0006828AC5|nr:oligosaccharide repeat unit polymerase [Roseobacter sp. AzwK-3b]
MSDVTFRSQSFTFTESVRNNPFVPISDVMRLVVVIYFVFWRFVPTLAVLSAQASIDVFYALTIAFFQFMIELLILYPFLLKRFAGTSIGWLHPLILPTVMSVSFGIVRSPDQLLTPITAWYQVQGVPDHMLLVGWPETRILEAQLKLNLINLLALICTYAGFSIMLRRYPHREQRPIRIDGARIALLFIVMFLVVFAFLQLQGGLIAHMSTLGGGRFRMRQLSGHFLVFNNFLPFLLLLWYAFRPTAIRNPLFIGAFVLSAVTQIIVTGSRSDLFASFALLLAVWIYHNRRIPTTRAVLLGLVAVLSLGVLGEVRRSGQSGQIDFTALMDFDLASAWEMSQEELENRRHGTGLAIAALVPDHAQHLLGTTYVAAAAFWVPRSIWRDKPRGAGAHAKALLFGDRETMEGYSGGGTPVNGAPEAYWNFSYPGVVIVFLLYGILCGAVTRWVMRQPQNPYVIVALLIFVFQFSTPSTTGMVPTLQSMTLLYLTYLFLNRLKMR